MSALGWHPRDTTHEFLIPRPSQALWFMWFPKLMSQNFQFCELPCLNPFIAYIIHHQVPLLTTNSHQLILLRHYLNRNPSALNVNFLAFQILISKKKFLNNYNNFFFLLQLSLRIFRKSSICLILIMLIN